MIRRQQSKHPTDALCLFSINCTHVLVLASSVVVLVLDGREKIHLGDLITGEHQKKETKERNERKRATVRKMVRNSESDCCCRRRTAISFACSHIYVPGLPVTTKLWFLQSQVSQCVGRTESKRDFLSSVFARPAGIGAKAVATAMTENRTAMTFILMVVVA
jgi:hypothetical protein